jgi:hypothetical protein
MVGIALSALYASSYLTCVTTLKILERKKAKVDEGLKNKKPRSQV